MLNLYSKLIVSFSVAFGLYSCEKQHNCERESCQQSHFIEFMADSGAFSTKCRLDLR